MKREDFPEPLSKYIQVRGDDVDFDYAHVVGRALAALEITTEKLDRALSAKIGRNQMFRESRDYVNQMSVELNLAADQWSNFLEQRRQKR